jgi:hypothetical protein
MYSKYLYLNESARINTIQLLLRLPSMLLAVLKPGFKMTFSGTTTRSPRAAPCEADTYNSGNNRVTNCTGCPNQLTVPAGAGVNVHSCSEYPNHAFWHYQSMG